MAGSTIGSNVSSIGECTFGSCGSLTSVTIPRSVTSIGEEAFALCLSLTGVYFQGNAPGLALDVFFYPGGGPLPPCWDPATIYYLPGTTGWDQWVSPPPAVLWNPSIQTTNDSFGVLSNQFEFTITGTTNIPILVEACTNLASASWTTLQTCTLTNGSIYFSDPQCTNYPARFYRLRSP